MQKDTIILASGCFWCTEAVYSQLDGVEKITPGYIGGEVENPTYEQVCTGTTNHAEAIKIIYDKDKLSFMDLLMVFFTSHDPTSLNRQGNDIGTQYRSEIFYTNSKQKEEAEKLLDSLHKAALFPQPIVTKISEATKFYEAEDYHKNYYENNPEKAYCQVVIKPKLDKLYELFPAKVKK